MPDARKKGLLAAFACYVIWGTLPVFWKFLSAVPSSLVQAQRMVWCCVCVVVFCALAHRRFRHLFSDSRAVKTFLISGALCTVNWLQLFSEAANRIPLTWVGFCQYLSPTLALIIGVALFGEPFTSSHAILFGCLWTGIALIALEAFVRWHKAR